MSNVIEIEPEAFGRPAQRLAGLAFTADELAGSEAPRRLWHAKPAIPAKAVTLLQGDGGTGKSLAALQLAASTALGVPWLGLEVRQGNVLYLSAEDDRDEIHRRLEAITLDHGCGLEALTGLKVLDMTGQDAVLAAADNRGRLASTDRWAEFEAIARDWEPTLIAIDNLADVFAGDENSRPQARQFIGLLQSLTVRQSASVLLIGHPSLAGMASGTGSSGSTAWNNSVRSRLYLTKPAPVDGVDLTPDVRVLTVKKANYGPTNTELRLRWSAGVLKPEGDGAAPLAGVDLQIAEIAVEHTFLALLDAYSAQGRHVSHKTGHAYAPALFAKDPLAMGARKAGLTAAMNRLFAAGEIVVEEFGPPSRRIQRLVRSNREAA